MHAPAVKPSPPPPQPPAPPQPRLTACVDIGGTKVVVALANAQSQHTLQLYARQTEPTVKAGQPDALAQQILKLVANSAIIMGVERSQINSICISSCGPFVIDSGKLALAAPNICGGLAGAAYGLQNLGLQNPSLPNDWTHLPLQAQLEQHFAHVHIENDAVAALQAERRWGALQGFDHCAYVTWSTGIGVGLCIDGRVLRGKNGNAGHAGHMFVSNDKSGLTEALCGCGNVGDVEGLVAGNAIERRFGQDANTLLSSSGSTQAVDALCRDLGRMLYNLVITLDLQRICLGGSVFWHHQDLLLPKLQAQLTGKLPSLTDGCTLVPAGLGLQVGELAALALTQFTPLTPEATSE